MKILRDKGRDELRQLDEDAKQKCSVCSSGRPPSGHHHHFCLTCSRALTADEDPTHEKESATLPRSSTRTSHRIQFCPSCAPPRELNPESPEARQAKALFERFGSMLRAVLDAERLLSIRVKWRGTERIVPRETWPPIEDRVEYFGAGMTGRLDKGLRLALRPLALMPSTILENHGQRVLTHPGMWRAFSSLVSMAAINDSRGEAARHEIRTIAALLAGDRKPIRRPGREFDQWLFGEFERQCGKGKTILETYTNLVNRTGFSLNNVQKRVSRERERAGKKKTGYVERKGPARGKRRR